MKLRNKILMTTAPLAVVATTMPVAMTSCSSTADIYLPVNQKKELDLTRSSSSGIYYTPSNSIMIDLADKFHFPATETNTHAFKPEIKNKKLNGQDNSSCDIELTDGDWSYVQEKPDTITGWIGRLSVSSTEELKTNDVISFDLLLTFGTVDAEGKTFTPTSSTVTFGGWKLTVK